MPPVVGAVDEGSPGARAGLEAGDRVHSRRRQPIEGWEEWVEFLQSRPGETVELDGAARGDRELTLDGDARQCH